MQEPQKDLQLECSHIKRLKCYERKVKREQLLGVVSCSGHKYQYSIFTAEVVLNASVAHFQQPLQYVPSGFHFELTGRCSSSCRKESFTEWFISIYRGLWGSLDNGDCPFSGLAAQTRTPSAISLLCIMISSMSLCTQNIFLMLMLCTYYRILICTS